MPATQEYRPQKFSPSFPSFWLDRTYGEVHKVRHFVTDASGRKKDLAHIIKERWLNGNGTSPVLHICGELSSIFTVEETLKRKRPVLLVIGNELIDARIRDRLADLAGDNPDLLSVFRAGSRPDMHGTLIDNNIFVEEWHEFGETYAYAKAIEKATFRLITVFREYFDQISRNRPRLTPGEIRAVPVRIVAG